MDASCIAMHRYYRGEPAEDVEAYTTWVASRIERSTYLGYVAEVEGDIVAGAGATLLDWGPTRGDPNGLRARIVNVFTHPAWRNRGVATALVRAVMAACSDRGVATYSLASTSEGAALYGSLGFVPYPEEMIRRRE